jgi:biopolymer transport protein ExbB
MKQVGTPKSHRLAIGARLLSFVLGAVLIALFTVANPASAQGPAGADQLPASEGHRMQDATGPAMQAGSGEGAPRALPEPTMDTNMADAAPTSAGMPHDLSPWGMFLAADMVVKGVMLGLAFASLVTWTVWIAKGLEIIGAKRRIRRAVELLGQAKDLVEAREQVTVGSNRRGPAVALVEAAHLELKRSDSLPAEGIKERVAISLSRIEAHAGRQMGRGTGILATIGSTAPFVGLFGTVWGIMNSFIGISQSQTTNLAVVAPGIAEALLATAIGLIAAIPAVVIYNIFARSIAGYRALLSDASAEVMRHLSRDLDRRITTVSPVIPLQTVAARVRKAE